MTMLVAIAVAAILALVGIGDLVFAKHEWSTRQRVAAWACILLLLVSAAMMLGMPGWASHGWIFTVAGMALASFVCALFSTGRFRWMMAVATICWLIGIFPIVAFLGSGQGVR